MAKHPLMEEDNNMRPFGVTQFNAEGEPIKIKINVKKGDVVNTIIHENLHAENPEMTEKQVRVETREEEADLSLPEQAGLLLATDARIELPERKGLTIHHTRASKVIKRDIKTSNVEEA